MIDETEKQSSEPFDLQPYLGVVRRRHFHFLIPLLLGWAMVWGTSWIIPPRYQSSTLILVEQPTMPKDYVTPNISDDLQERLQSITQQILSRTRLLRIADQFNLDATQLPDARVESMRRSIEIELVRDPRNQINAFNLRYSSRDPHVAQEITNELTNMFISENLAARQKQSEDTTNFLESQLESARSSLTEQEEKIREFKAQHVGEMPAQLASNLQILTGLQGQLQTEEDALNAAQQQHVYLQTLADQYRAMQSSVKAGDGTIVGLPALDDELEKLRAQLADLSTRYTENHPDVRKVKEQIAKTQRMRDEFLAEVKANRPEPTRQGGDAGSTSNESPNSTPNATQSSLVAQIESQLRSNQIEITNREHSIAGLKDRVEQYQARLNQEPVREQQLADLTRGYDQSKANYDELLKKKNESAMATSMELRQQGERFRILDPPSFPQKPDFPNRLKFCGIGLGIGVLFGVVVAGAFELLDDRLHSEKELTKELNQLFATEVISEIPAIMNPSDVKSNTRKAVFRWAMAALVFSIILVGSAFSYLHR